MKRIIVAISALALTLAVIPVANAQVTASVIVSAPLGGSVADADAQLPARVTFSFDGEGKFILWGRFLIDGVEGPSIYRTLEMPADPIVFDTFLPTYFSGSHEACFEILSPNHLKTNIFTYKVNSKTAKTIIVTSPQSGTSVDPGAELVANAEINVTGIGIKTISGYWLIDNTDKIPFSQTAQIANIATIKIKQSLPTYEPGDHKFKVVLESPTSDSSDEVTYKVVNKAPIIIKFDTSISDINIALSSKAKITANITITQTGTYDLVGGLYIDGVLAIQFVKTLTGPGTFSFDFEIPTSVVGSHTIQFRLTAPAAIASNIVTYRVVGESWVWPQIIYPADGTTVNQGSYLEAKLALRVGGHGTQKVVGNWMLDANPWRSYEQLLTISSDTILYETIALPTDAPGWHKLKFVMSWPQREVSNEIWYRVWGREQPPSFIDIMAMPQPPYPQTETFQLHIKANDDRGIKRCFVQIGSGIVVSSDMGGIQIIDYLTPPLGPFPPGDYFWRVVIEDLDGLDAEYTGRFQVTSGKGAIEGYVMEKNTNRPLSGATVSCGNRTVTADLAGKYKIEDLGYGNQVIWASYTGKKTGQTTVNVFGSSVAIVPTIYLDEQGPVPVITQILTTPGPLYPGQSYDMHVFIRNDGAEGQDSEVAISCPDGIMLEIDPETGFQYPSQSQVFPPGSFIEHRDGQPIRAIHPVAIVKWTSWGPGVTRKVLIRFTPVEAKPYEFWIRTKMMSGNDWELSPVEGTTIDQQGFPVKVEMVNIIQKP